MKTLKAVVKLVITDAELRAMCVSSKGNTIALVIDLKDRPELKKLVDDFANKTLDHLEKEIG